MCYKCSICNEDITLEQIKNGRKTTETKAPGGGTYLSHEDCVERFVFMAAAAAGSQPNN